MYIALHSHLDRECGKTIQVVSISRETGLGWISGFPRGREIHKTCLPDPPTIFQFLDFPDILTLDRPRWSAVRRFFCLMLVIRAYMETVFSQIFHKYVILRLLMLALCALIDIQPR